MKATSGEVMFDGQVNTSDHGSGHLMAILPKAIFVGTTSKGHCTGAIVVRPEELFHSFVGGNEYPLDIQLVHKF